MKARASSTCGKGFPVSDVPGRNAAPARVTTSAAGNLFRDAVQNHGRQMAKAE
jgi:hypothetical protein